jgi:peptidoglycan/xylan/chitin deacetylase (PgdA/CDA1 family)
MLEPDPEKFHWPCGGTRENQMIAVATRAEDHPVVAEFFELFKTPWEFFRAGSRASVLLCSQAEIPLSNARLVLVYGGAENSFDRENGIAVQPQVSGKILAHDGRNFPIYGSCVTAKNSSGPVLRKINSHGQTFVRIGYDLFSEIRHLLTVGQPAEHAPLPALEIHIALLRGLIVSQAIPLIEIPPVPAGRGFIACLTHDVDHVGIRNHQFDHTMFGFLYRATIGSMLDVAAGKKTFAQLAANCLAALKLPFVQLGLVRDFWYQFDHYVEIENGAASTFFVIPKKGETGLDANGSRPPKRAASYDAAGLKDILRQLGTAGKEIGVHGLDAWRDAAAGRTERDIISQLTGVTELGVRMHWLYFGEQSHAELERAGFTYDSTVGYNGTVGYRAGTTQVFKPLTTAKLLELPMHVMDTALFYPSYLNLSPRQAVEKVRPLIADAVHFGGVLTVNWHDRSLAPERLWDGSYRRLLEEFKAKGAWFATAAQTVAWFKKRRAMTFDSTAGEGQIKIKTGGGQDGLPALRVRIFQPDANGGKFVEKPLPDGGEICLAA